MFIMVKNLLFSISFDSLKEGEERSDAVLY